MSDIGMNVNIHLRDDTTIKHSASESRSEYAKYFCITLGDGLGGGETHLFISNAEQARRLHREIVLAVEYYEGNIW